MRGKATSKPPQQESALAMPQPAKMSVIAPGETASSALAMQAKAMIEARYVIALNNPRDIDMVRERLLKECRRPSFAEVARYRKPIGKGIEGPSIRFAEAAIRCMGNIVVETATIYDDAEKRIVRVSVTDLEANVPYSQDVTIHKTVERKNPKEGDQVLGSRINSQGQMTYLLAATDDDILNKQNALISKAIRTLGLRLVPGDIVDECQDLVLKTQRDKAAQDPDAERRRIFDAFGNIGVRVEQLKAYLGHSGETLNPSELVELRGLFAAIKDGEMIWREVMDERVKSQVADANGETVPTTTVAPSSLNEIAERLSSQPTPDELAKIKQGELELEG